MCGVFFCIKFVKSDTMALTPNYTVAQSAGDLTTLILTDTSTGSDPAVTGRLVYIQDVDGNFYVPSGTTTAYIYWPAGDSAIEIEGIIPRDLALEILVVWYTGSTASYTKQILWCVNGYGLQFLFELTQFQELNSRLVTNKNYYESKVQLYVNLEDAENAVTIGNNQAVAQAALDRAQQLRENKSLFF